MPAVMLWLALAVIWLLGAIGQPRFRVRFGWVDLAVLMLVGWHTIAAVWAAGHASPRPAVNMLWEWVGFAVSFVLMRQLVAGPREARAMVAVMCGLAVALAAFGLYQYLCEMPATRAAYEADPDKALADAGLWLPAGSPERMMYENRLASVEPIATFALANSLAGLLAPCLVVLVGVIVLARAGSTNNATGSIPSRAVSARPLEASEDACDTGRADTARLGMSGSSLGRRVVSREWLSPAGAAVCAVVVAACLLLTKSRSGYLAVLFGLGLVGWTRRGRSARVPWKVFTGAALLAVAVLVAAIAVGGLDREVVTQAAKSLGYRGQYWRSSLAMIADHPLMGCGPGNFQDAYKAYKLPEASEEIADPHNFLFEVWATAGTPAMLALVAVLAGFFVTALRGSSKTVFSGRLKRPEEAVQPNGSERAAFVCAGAAAGFVLVVPVSAVSPVPPELPLFAVAVPCVGFAAWTLWSWVARGQLSVGLAAIGVVVLLVHLCAAGGIGFAGVAGSLWLLMAIGLNIAEDWRHRFLPKWSSFLALAALCSVAFACYASGYGPVLRSHAAMRLAQLHPLQAEKHLLEAARADPWAVKPWNQLAADAFAAWRGNPGDDALRRFESYSERLLERAPRASAIWEATGDRYLEIYRRTNRRHHVEQAVLSLRRATELYPNSAAIRARLAMAWRAAGDEVGYEAERNRALTLDRLTPHLDKKLPRELRDSLERR